MLRLCMCNVSLELSKALGCGCQHSTTDIPNGLENHHSEKQMALSTPLLQTVRIGPISITQNLAT